MIVYGKAPDLLVPTVHYLINFAVFPRRYRFGERHAVAEEFEPQVE